jgi:sugar phosphate isomerase/epimerase
MHRLSQVANVPGSSSLSIEPREAIMKRTSDLPEPALSMCQITTKYLGFEEDVYAYKKAGMDGISISWDKLRSFGIARGIRLLRETDLPVVSMIGGPYLSGSPALSQREAQDELTLELDVCAQLGAGVLGVVAGNRDGRSFRETEEVTIQALTQLGEEAGKRKVILGLEPIHAPYFDFLNTLADARKIIQAVDSPFVGITFDAWHLCHEPDLDLRIEETSSDIVLVHFSDWRVPTRYHDDRLIPGEGVLPLRSILRKLHDSGYRGYYDVEIFSEDVWTADQNENLRKCRQFFDSVWEDQRP